MSVKPRNPTLFEFLRWSGGALVIVGVLISLPLFDNGTVRPEADRASVILGLLPLGIGVLMLTLAGLRSHRRFLVLVLCVTSLLGGYVAAYRKFGTVDDYPDAIYRTYSSRLECRVFVPLGWIESKWTQDVVILEVPAEYDPIGNLHDGPAVRFRP